MSWRKFGRMTGLITLSLCFAQEAADPWPASALLEAPDFAKTLRSADKKPLTISVAFPILYKSRRIVGSVFAGAGRDPAGIEMLKKTVAGVAKDADIVLYCGCCPMAQCPNLRPAYRALKELGYIKVRVLRIPTNMATDWYAKNYPSEEGTPDAK